MRLTYFEVLYLVFSLSIGFTSAGEAAPVSIPTANTASTIPANDSLIKCTVVRAYPDKMLPTDKHDYTYHIPDDINLDVRGLGTWLTRLSTLGVAGKTIQDIIGKGPPNKPNSQDYALWIRDVQSATKTLCLYIDGRPVNDLVPYEVTPKWKDETPSQYDSVDGCPLMTLRFRLVRNPADTADPNLTGNNYKPWNIITTSLYSKMGNEIWSWNPVGVKTDFTVGLPDPQGIGIYFMSSALNPSDSDPQPGSYTARLVPYSPLWMFGSMVVILMILASCIYLGKTSDLLRDTTTTLNPGGRYPFSLGLCQMAFWTVVITGCFLFIWISSSNYNTFNSTALVLLGISSATGLGASLINNSDPNRPVSSKLTPTELALFNITDLSTALANEITALNAIPTGSPPAKFILASDRIDEFRYRLKYVRAPKCRFLYDLLSERIYLTFHRFQLLVWTVILATVFVWGVWAKLDMPVFDASILILMGISSGAYIGFKFRS
jgi:hypothetical protein